MNWQILFNPVKRFETRYLFFVGFVFFLIGSWLASRFNFTFDGVLSVHRAVEVSLVRAIKENIVNIAILVLLLFLIGVAINRKTRVVDILNVVLIFRIPFYLVIFLSNIPFVRKAEEAIREKLKDSIYIHVEPSQAIALSVFSIVVLLLLIYAIVLLFKGFKTATNAKKWQHYVLFFVVLLLAEFISKLIL